jgi:hypothetical protein
MRRKKPRPPCHSRCGTEKIPPCSKALSAERRPKFCILSQVMVTSPRKWKILQQDVKQLVNKQITWECILVHTCIANSTSKWECIYSHKNRVGTRKHWFTDFLFQCRTTSYQQCLRNACHRKSRQNYREWKKWPISIITRSHGTVSIHVCFTSIHITDTVWGEPVSVTNCCFFVLNQGAPMVIPMLWAM